MTTVDALLKARRVRRGSVPVGTLLAALVVVVVAVAAVAPQALTSYDPEKAALDSVFLAPSLAHPFGTDQLGRDVLARVIHGAQYSLLIGLGAAVLSLALGVVVGLLAVYLPFGLDRLVQRGIDILLAFPELLLALLVIAVLGRGPVNTLIAVGLSGLAGYARLVRSQVLAARLSGYAEQAKVLGERPLPVVLRHVLPNIARPLTVLATLGVGSAILAASSLSFLGLGVTPPTPEWGAILSEGRSQLGIAPWTSLLPATVVAVTVISITVLGRALQARLTQRGRA
ncbi:ABC transporter permease [Microbacterium betulae]|uniref:ABC transporter permease n=1 Tax=Microbacterium betulae TaxID=2981139 RepID=A0AA97FI79_9MICO|nr:ABC transporter permease [Microbacterium sp. AB]WOF23044.1 ABC transporter permease [Microbacterium sp. AB]